MERLSSQGGAGRGRPLPQHVPEDACGEDPAFLSSGYPHSAPDSPHPSRRVATSSLSCSGITFCAANRDLSPEERVPCPRRRQQRRRPRPRKDATESARPAHPVIRTPRSAAASPEGKDRCETRDPRPLRKRRRGKSTVAVNLAYSLSSHGYQVGLLDLDIHGPNIPIMLGIQDRKLSTMGNLIEPIRITGSLSAISMAFLLPDVSTPIIWRGPMKMVAIRQFLEEVNWGAWITWWWTCRPVPAMKPSPSASWPRMSAAHHRHDAAGGLHRRLPEGGEVRGEDGFRVLGIIENMSGMACPHCGKEIDLFGSGGGKRAAEEMGVPSWEPSPWTRRCARPVTRAGPL